MKSVLDISRLQEHVAYYKGIRVDEPYAKQLIAEIKVLRKKASAGEALRKGISAYGINAINSLCADYDEATKSK